MVIVIFRARLAAPDDAYGSTAARLRTLAFERYGCLDFSATNEGLEEIAVSYWPSVEHVERWRADPEHRAAQALGRDRWYESYSVEVAVVERAHHWSREDR